MKVLVAEKPSVARDHYRKLLERKFGETFQQNNGYLQGQNYIITWCVGHLVTLAPFDKYPGYSGSWQLSNLPLLPQNFELEVIERTAQQFTLLTRILESAEEIINGADAGREGNLIFDLVIDKNPKLKDKPLKRLWVNSYVEEDLDKAWDKLETCEKRINLSYAAKLRQRADWLVGLNATRAYTLTAGAGSLMSVGRVQTPTLNLIVQRDEEVEGFQELFYYGLKSQWNQVEFRWIREDKIHWDEDKPFVEKILKQFTGKTAELIEWSKSTKKSYPPKPYDLTDLQKDANKKLKMKAARTLEIAQLLYEKKLTTYPRTDSAYLPDNMKNEAYQLASRMAPENQKNLFRPLSENFVFINSKKVTDHYAILPTGKSAQGISSEEQSLLKLITERFTQAWLQPQIWIEAQATLKVTSANGDEFLRTKLKVEKQAGWKSLKRSDTENQQNKEDSLWLKSLPEWQVGMIHPLIDLELTEKKKPKPKYFTEATLLTAMKTAGRQIDDEELAEAMKERGLGTPATQAGIIETLIHRKFIQEEKGFLMSTSVGRRLIDKVDDLLKSPELTGDWEFKLKMVEKGQMAPEAFFQETCGYVQDIFSSLKSKFIHSWQREEHHWDANCLKCNTVLNTLNWGLKCNSCDFTLPFQVAGRDFSIDEIKTLLNQDSFEKLEGFVSKRGFHFSAGVHWDEEFKLSLKFENDPKREFKETKHKCPACKSGLSANEAMLRCSNERCRFVMWKTVAQLKLTEKIITQILKKKTSDPLEGFVSKKGKSFNAKLKLNDQYKIEFEFDNTPPAAIPCPKCSSALKNQQSMLGCSCGWQSHTVFARKQLSREELTYLFVKKKSKRISGFKGKDGSPFSCFLKLDEHLQIQYDLESIKKL